VIACYLFTNISFLWYNVIGCALVMILSLVMANKKAGQYPASL
jgi:hypothetical protein